MSSLVAWVGVTEKARLRVLEIDIDEDRRLMQALGVSTVPALVLVQDRSVIGRLEGRATGRQIERLIRPHVAPKPRRTRGRVAFGGSSDVAMDVRRVRCRTLRCGRDE